MLLELSSASHCNGAEDEDALFDLALIRRIILLLARPPGIVPTEVQQDLDVVKLEQVAHGSRGK
jgi:hypothetical protein